MKSRIISKLFLNFSRKKPKEKSKKRIETSEHHVARIHRFFEQREDDGQIRQCGRLRIHVPVRPDLSSAYGRSGAQVHVTHLTLLYPTVAHRIHCSPRVSLSTGKRNENKEIGFSSIVASSASARRRIESANPVNRLIAEFEQAISSLDLLRERSVAKVGQQIFASILQEARSHEWSIPFTKIWPSGELVRGRISCPFDIPTLFAILLFRLLSMIRDHGGGFSGKNGFSVGCGNF